MLWCRDIWERTIAASKSNRPDIHTKLMRKYPDIPQWWFYVLLCGTLAVAFALCEFYKEEVQLPWWGLLFACALASFFTLPISIITATTNQVSPLIFSLVEMRFYWLFCSRNFTIVFLLILYFLLFGTHTRLEHYHWIPNGIYPSWEAHCQCLLQGLWLHEYEPGSFFLARLQAWSLHENPTSLYVPCTGMLCYISK